ncbi:MAG: DUF58 domain-containing protein [Lachnospiraceae bacterium]|nr:DUF58 domain-containing protein [Lachnospiraceae bacterium]
MIWIILLSVLCTAAVLEYFSIRYAMKRLQLEFRTDLALSEPGETVTLSFTIRNTSRFPQLYISASVYFEDGLRICESEDFMAKYVEKNAANIFKRRYFLLPHQAVTEKIRFCAKKRGVFHVGRCYLECGDLLGLKSVVKSFPVGNQLVCTAKYLEDLPAFDPLGGTDGDFSVQRFINEDPTLVYGYRDYTGREPMRQISWKATARTGRLIVREQDHTLEKNATVLCDLRTGTPDDLERTLELVRTVCEVLEEGHVPYVLITNSDLGSVPEGLGRQHVHLIQQKIGISRPIAYFSFETMLPQLLSGPAHSRNFILIAPAPTDQINAYLPLLERDAASETIVFYGKEAAS